MLSQEIIRKKRDHQKLTGEEIQSFVTGVPSGQVSESQVAAFCMAVLLNGMEMDERVALTSAMAQSGRVLDWSALNLPGPVLDKHSTGGIGDKVSLILAPVIAACGGFVPMLSGRGLGHTGGTLDKMDSIPGYVSQPDLDLLEKAIQHCGCAVIGATKDLAPADRIMYSIRDVTATVESIDLITASILAKKLAGGLDGLVMDVKFGSGAFMKDYKDAKALAESIVSVANGAGLPTVALMTDMNQVLGRTAGNAVEVQEAVDFLTGHKRDARLEAVTVGLCAELLVLGKVSATVSEAREKIQQCLDNGQAAERFQKMVSVLGGPEDFVENSDRYLKKGAVQLEVYADQAGYVTKMDARDIGIAIVELGGGRRKSSDAIDHAVGLTDIAQIGEAVGPDKSPLAVIHAQTREAAEKAADKIKKTIKISEKTPVDNIVVQERVEG